MTAPGTSTSIDPRVQIGGCTGCRHAPPTHVRDHRSFIDRQVLVRGAESAALPRGGWPRNRAEGLLPWPPRVPGKLA